MNYKLKHLIVNSQRIFITSHISPDWDAFSSTLLAYRILKLNYPEKQIKAVLEEKIKGLDFLADAKKINFYPVSQAVEEFKPDLLIMLDGNNYARFSREHSKELKDSVKCNKTKTVIIDHHETDNADRVNLFIHRGSPSTAQDIYWLFAEDMKLKMPKKVLETTLVGILGDTGRFKYQNAKPRETFEITARALDDGVNIEAITNRLTQYTKPEILVLGELCKNIELNPEFSFSFISDAFTMSFTKNNPPKDIKSGCEIFVNAYSRNIEGRRMGFAVYPDVIRGNRHYGVSLRAVNGAADVSKVARELGGGGHKPAAGGLFEAENVHEAVAIVKQAIANNLLT